VPAFGGSFFIADKSAWTCASDPTVRDEWAEALRAGQIATTSITVLELLYSARTSTEFAALEEELHQLRLVRTTQSVLNATVTALRELSTLSDGFHRVPIPDALVAAAAQDAGLGVLHYDHHYDRLATVLHFESRWIASPGSVA
jgi:predicted nucleic acid-binding protein